MLQLMESVPVSDMARRAKEVLDKLKFGPIALYQRSEPAAVMVLPSEWNSAVEELNELRKRIEVLEAAAGAEALVLHPETLEAFEIIQEHRVSIGLNSQTVVDLIDRLVQVERDRVTDGSDFSAATYEMGKVIMDNTGDDEWVSAEEFLNRDLEGATVG